MEVKLASWIHLGLFIPETKHYILTYLKRKCKIPCSHQNHCLVYFLPKRLLPEDKLVETILFHQFLLLLQQRYNFVPLKLKQVSGNWKDLKSKGDGDRNLIAGLHGKRWQAVARAKRCHHSELECMQSEKLNCAALLKLLTYHAIWQVPLQPLDRACQGRSIAACGGRYSLLPLASSVLVQVVFISEGKELSFTRDFHNWRREII